MDREYLYTHPTINNAIGGDARTGTKWNESYETTRTDLLNAVLAQVAADVSFLYDAIAGGDTDNITYEKADASTITVHAGKAITADGHLYTVSNDTSISLDADLDTGTKAPSTTYYLWIGEDSLSGDTVIKFSLSSTEPLNMVDPYRLKYYIETDASSNIVDFAHLSDLAALETAFKIGHTSTGAHTATAASEIAALLSSQLLSSAQKTDLTDGGNSTAHYHSADRAATTLGGLSLNSTYRNNEPNKVMRTDSCAYANFGWINTTSGDTASPLSRAFVNTGDGYIRMCTLAHLVGQLRPNLIVHGSFSGNNTSNRVISTELSKQTRIVWVMSADGYQYWGRAGCTSLIHSLAVGSFQINYNAAFACNVSGKSYYWLAVCF